MKVTDYWQCPSCKNRYWTLWGRPKMICPGDACRTRCIPITLKAYAEPDGPGVSSAWLCVTDPLDPKD